MFKKLISRLTTKNITLHTYSVEGLIDYFTGCIKYAKKEGKTCFLEIKSVDITRDVDRQIIVVNYTDGNNILFVSQKGGPISSKNTASVESTFNTNNRMICQW